MSDHGDINNLWSPSQEVSENDVGNHTNFENENDTRVETTV